MASVLVTNFGVVVILIAECQPIGFWRGKSAVCWPTHIRIYFIYATIGAYCVAGIWSNLELFLGIIAANLALTRSIYVHFFSNGTAQQTLPVSTGRCDPLQSEYLNSKLRGDRFEVPSTMIGSPCRRGSETRSSDSEIPLRSGIQKKTEFWWTEDDEGQAPRPSP
ncbi:integral membrane protein [Colletotrichum cuscutae]|uniref:Integral membrane protein n=1 Tax=Colletotrichum cuscutae TaxID=1209917 RepID=A0AAI9YDB3_9PEZI|nr:integral membrane protein [Colletotrichum cuscutae]